MTRIIDLPELSDWNIHKLWARINELESSLKFECAHCHQVSRAFFADDALGVAQNGNLLHCEHCDKSTLIALIPYKKGTRGTIQIELK